MFAEKFGILPGSHLRASDREDKRSHLCFCIVIQFAL